MDIEKANELLGQSGWTELSVTLMCCVVAPALTSMGRSPRDFPSEVNVPTTLGVSSPDACMISLALTQILKT